MRRRLLFCLLATGLWIFLAAGAKAPIDTSTPSTPPSASLAVSAPGLIALGPAPTTSASVDVEGEEEEEEIEPEFVTDLPEDPFEVGESTLVLTLLDAATGGPVKSQIQLWRIDAPGNEHWRNGDRLRATHEVTAEDVPPIERLPEGVYRMHAGAQARGSQDLPSFTVGKGTNHVTLSLPMPRAFPVWVEIRDEHGQVLTDASLRSTGRSSYSRSTKPDWVKARRLRGDRYASIGIGGSAGCGSGGGRGKAEPVRAENDRFAGGSVHEPSRTASSSRSFRLEPPGYSAVRVWVSYEFPREHVYRATVVALSDVYDVVLLPDGRRAIDAGATFDVVVRAQLDGGEKNSTEGIDVSVRLAGYQRTKRTLVPGRPWEKLAMVSDDA